MTRIPPGLPPHAWPPRRSRRARRHLVRLAVLCLYGAAAFLVHELVVAERAGDPPGARLDGAAAAVPPPAAAAAAPSPSPRPADAGEAAAAAGAARASVFRLDSPAGLLGSAFVAWIAGGRTYLLTAYPAVQAVVTDGHGELLLRRGPRIWRPQVVREDKLTGLVLLRVEARLPRPLWTQPHLLEPEHGEPLGIAPAPGRGIAAAVGAAEVAEAMIRLETTWSPHHLGAPVVAGDGTVTGVVVSTDATGAARVTPLRDACGKIRNC